MVRRFVPGGEADARGGGGGARATRGQRLPRRARRGRAL